MYILQTQGYNEGHSSNFSGTCCSGGADGSETLRESRGGCGGWSASVADQPLPGYGGVRPLSL